MAAMRRMGVLGLVLLGGVAAAQAPQNPLGQQSQVPNDLVHAMAMSAKGTLAIRAVQGTKDGPAVGGEEVEVVVFHRDRPIQHINATLDEHGLLVVENLPVSLGIRALVRVKHAGVLYQDASPPMNDANPSASVDITVHEISDDPQPWRILVRQLAAAVVADGIDVAETVVIENQGDRTWMGEPADAEGRRATVRLMLPPDAVEVELLQGFHGWCCSAYKPPELAIQMPMMPGQMTYRFAYKIPVRSGASDLRFASGAPSDRVVVIVPATGMEPSGVGLERVGVETVGDVQIARFEGTAVELGASVGLTLTSVQPLAAPPTTQAASMPAPKESRKGMPLSVWIAMLLVVFGGGIVAARKARSAKSS